MLRRSFSGSLEVDPAFEPDVLVRWEMERIRERRLGRRLEELTRADLEQLRPTARQSRVDLLTRRALSDYGRMTDGEWFGLRREIDDKKTRLDALVEGL